MSLLPFLAVALGAGCLSLLTRRAARASAVFGLAGLVAAGGLAALVRPEEPFRIAGGAIAGSEFARLFLVLGSVGGLLLAVVALATTWPRSLPGATLVGLGAAGFALGVVDPGTAVAAATSGAVVSVLVTVFGPPSQRRILVAARELRALVVAGVLGLVAAGAAAGPVAAARIDPAILGLAYLGFASAVAIRFGAIPFHLWAARVAEAAPEVGLPLIMAWGPAAFAVVGLAWVDASVAPSGASLIVERGLIVAIGAASIALGTVAAFLHDDIEHVVGYSIVADGGIALLGLGALDQAAWGPTRMWLLALVVTKTAFAAWAAAMRATFGTGRIDELRGWASRAPVLGLALVAIVLASVGWPGMAAFAARGTLVGLVLDAPLSSLLLAFALSAILYYGRLAVIGLLRPGPLVAAAGSRPRPATIGVKKAPDPAAGNPTHRLAFAGEPGRRRRGRRAGPVRVGRRSLGRWPERARRRRRAGAGIQPGRIARCLRGPSWFWQPGAVRLASGHRHSPAIGERAQLGPHCADTVSSALGAVGLAAAVRDHASAGLRLTSAPGGLAFGGRPPFGRGSVAGQSGGASAQRSMSRSYSSSSSALNHKASSAAAVSGASDAWIRFCAVSTAKSPRIVPAAASWGRVAPTIERTTAMALGPSNAAATSGPEVMKSTRPRKKGFSRWTA